MAKNKPTAPDDGLSSEEFYRLLAWMITPERPSANLAFTAGVLRDCATALEIAIAILVGKGPPISRPFGSNQTVAKPLVWEMFQNLHQRLEMLEAWRDHPVLVTLTAPLPRTPDSSAAPPD